MKVLKSVNFDQTGRIAVTVNRRIELITINRILYCKASGNYSVIYLTDGTTYMNCQNLKCLCQDLEEFGFFTIDKSLLVNLLFIKSITQERNAKVLLDNNTELKIARERKSKLMELLF